MKLAQMFRSLFVRKPAVRKAPARSFCPHLECLSERIMPAVSATVSAGVLTVKPTLANDGNPDLLTIVPVAGFAGRFTLTSTNGFLNNTPFGTFDAIGVTAMKFDLGEGNDSLEATDLVLAGGFTFLGGNGSNTLKLNNCLIGGSVSVTNLTNATGTDYTIIEDSRINGSVSVNGGLGNTNGQFNNVKIFGSLSYTTLSSADIPGNDAVLVPGLSVGGGITLMLANGDNQFTGSVTPLEIGGSLNYSGGTGKDKVDFLSGAVISNSATIALGEGNNFMTCQGSTGLFIGTKLTVTAGAGEDYVELSSTAMSRVYAGATFNLGNGANTFKITTGLRAASLGLTTGTGDDTITLDNLAIAGGLSFVGGDGANTFQLDNSIVGSVNIKNLTNTTGTDFTVIQSSTINGGFTMNGGLGDTITQFNSVYILGSLMYTALSSDSILGDDSITAQGLYVGGNINLALAKGENEFKSAQDTVEAGGSFTYTGGAGTDKLFFDAGAIIGTFASITLGDGANLLAAQFSIGLFVGTYLNVTAGAGGDFVALTSSNLSRVKGNASFNLGSGNNTFMALNLQAGSLGLVTGAANDTVTVDNMTVIGAATFNVGAGVNTVKLASSTASSTASSIGGSLTVNAGIGADTIRVGSNDVVRVGGVAKFTLGTTAVGNDADSLQINTAIFASALNIVTGSGSDVIAIAQLASVSVAGKLNVNANAGDDQLFLGVFSDANKTLRLLMVPTLIGGAGAADIVRIFGLGSIQGPPSPPNASVLPTGPGLLAAGWEGIA
jgi:hypothetical protein